MVTDIYSGLAVMGRETSVKVGKNQVPGIKKSPNTQIKGLL